MWPVFLREQFRELPLELERYSGGDHHVTARVLIVASVPRGHVEARPELALLTNGAGAMARLAVDLGRVMSKYDCLLGANLHPAVPVDRHVLAKRVRVWGNANGFLAPLDGNNLLGFEPGPPACWRFAANGGDGRSLKLELRAMMVEGKNTTLLQFERPSVGEDLDRLEVALDGAGGHRGSEFSCGDEAERRRGSSLCKPHAAAGGTHGLCLRASDRPACECMRMVGPITAAPEWCEAIPHPVEANRGQVVSGDAYSPGWFDLPLAPAGKATLIVTAEGDTETTCWMTGQDPGVELTAAGRFEAQLQKAIQSFVVRRDGGQDRDCGVSMVFGLGPRHVDLRARIAGGRDGE
jgi:starch synthase (maltosyl-transferring)